MVKMVSLSDYAYELLTKKKKKNMSYSQVIISELGNKNKYQKTNTTGDLLKFINNLPKSSCKKTDLSKGIDKVVYGV
jgi:predicted CopG family antitoxin